MESTSSLVPSDTLVLSIGNGGFWGGRKMKLQFHLSFSFSSFDCRFERYKRRSRPSYCKNADEFQIIPLISNGTNWRSRFSSPAMMAWLMKERVHFNVQFPSLNCGHRRKTAQE
jgi:hypothetical protein